MRPHILLIAALAAAAFGFLFDGVANWHAAGWVAIDWLLLNFWNRLGDIAEDQLNGVPGAAFAAAHRRPLAVAAGVLFTLTLGLTLRDGVTFVLSRIGFQAVGFAYNFKLLPGGRRLKDLLAIKNLSAGLLFVLSDLGYPLLLRQGQRSVTFAEVVFLVAFFWPLEMTYELFYDLRDLAGDRAAGITTVPVRFGAPRARQAIAALITLSAAALVFGWALGPLSFLELLLIAAPVQQALVLALWFGRGVTPAGAVAVTYLGAAQLGSFLAWTGFGLPLQWPWVGP